MKLRNFHTDAGRSRATTTEVYFSATKNLVTDEVELKFHERGSDRRASISLTPDEARDLAKRIMEAAEGRFTITIADLERHNERVQNGQE